MFRVPGAALALLILLAGAPAWAAAKAKPLPDEMSLGSARAKVTVVEYASASCPHCARFNNEIFPAFRKKYVDTGKVRYVLKEFLTQPADLAAAGFILARCAGKDRYFAVLDEFFHQQAEIFRTGQALPALNAAGAKGGLEPDKVKACLQDEEALKALNARVQRYVEQDGVHATPTFVVNGTPLPETGREVELADLDAAIAPLLQPGKRR